MVEDSEQREYTEKKSLDHVHGCIASRSANSLRGGTDPSWGRIAGCAIFGSVNYWCYAGTDQSRDRIARWRGIDRSTARHGRADPTLIIRDSSVHTCIRRQSTANTITSHTNDHPLLTCRVHHDRTTRITLTRIWNTNDSTLREAPASIHWDAPRPPHAIPAQNWRVAS